MASLIRQGSSALLAALLASSVLFASCLVSQGKRERQDAEPAGSADTGNAADFFRSLNFGVSAPALPVFAERARADALQEGSQLRRHIRRQSALLSVPGGMALPGRAAYDGERFEKTVKASVFAYGMLRAPQGFV